jgi:hypothetical protein
MCPKIRCDEKSEKILQNFLGTKQGLKGKKKKNKTAGQPRPIHSSTIVVIIIFQPASHLLRCSALQLQATDGL